MSFIAGIDGGSVSIKLAVVNSNGEVVATEYRRHRGHSMSVALELLRELSDKYPGIHLSFTGSAGKLIAGALGAPHTNELAAQTEAVKRLYPQVRTIIEMGGEDSKLIILKGDSIEDFSLNSVCAAGTGSFLDQQAERLRLGIEEFSEMALQSVTPPRIAGRCSVFAKSDMIHLQQIATPVEDIVAGLCFAVARNFKGSIVKGRPIHMDVSFQGGVALNKGMIRAFREVFGLQDLIVPEYTALMGAVGTALKALDLMNDAAAGDERPVALDLARLEDAVASLGNTDSGHSPLIKEGDGFVERHLWTEDRSLRTEDRSLRTEDRREAYLGVDIGSISTNLAVIDEDGKLLAKRYLMTAGRPIEAVRQGLGEIGSEVGGHVDIKGVATTGSGRYMIADFIGADTVKNEITAQATAAAFIDPEVDTIFEIGGQDSKYISLKDGVIVDFEMNKACAAGTGSFLEEQAEKLDISIKGEFAECAFSAEHPCRLGERCTVFMENSLMSNLQRGSEKKDLLAGLSYSIVENYINRVVAGRRVGKHIFFQGGTAFNKSVVAAFEKFTGKEVTVPPNHDVTGAIGMALIARDHLRANSLESTSFKGFDLASRPYSMSSFECKGCENLCEINRVKIEGDEGYLFYGGRCEKYDIRKKATDGFPDLFAFREERLWTAHNRHLEMMESGRLSVYRGKIGIPYVFAFHDYLPYWSTLLWELGFDVVVSPRTNRKIANLGVETMLAESCFPVKVANGHIKHLLQDGIDTLFMPSFINLADRNDPYETGHGCPLTQSFPYQVRVAFEDARVIAPVIDLNEGDGWIRKELRKALKGFGVTAFELKKAMRNARSAQDDFLVSIKGKGREVLSEINQRSVVIVGRPYNAFDMGMNLELPKKLATLNVQSIPMDFLPDTDIHDEWPDMYWRSGQRMLRAARYVRNEKMLYPILIGNFSCGPDSFIERFFEKEITGKPYLHLEIDEHSADAGAVTRCEAFLDSIDAQISSGKSSGFDDEREEKEYELTKRVQYAVNGGSNGKRTVYLPAMCDHSRAIVAAFNYCGLDAELLPGSDKDAVDVGRKYMSGKECYPCTVTSGDMLKKALSPDFEPDKSAFFMPSGTGPCRFGQYNVLQSIILDDLGLDNVPIFSPVQDVSFYSDLGIIGSDFIKKSWQGIVAIDLLIKCLHETRPYERDGGSADYLYDEYLDKVPSALKSSNGDLMHLMEDMRHDFESIPRVEEKRPIIGIVGEIFVRSNRFSNEEIVRKVESLGGEAWLAPVDEWIYYVTHEAFRNALRKKDGSAMIQTLIKGVYQERVAHSLEKPFEGFLRSIHDPDVKKILKNASPYIHESFKGESVLSIGKSLDMIERGASGIINAMPFGCMPGTVVTAIMRGVTRDYSIPSISVPYDGTDSSTNQLQLEAFMEQAGK